MMRKLSGVTLSYVSSQFGNLVIPDLVIQLYRLRTTLVVQFKPHYIAAGSLSLAAKFHDVKLLNENGKVWWHQFDVAPKQLQGTVLL